jgi:tRNA pseudouridine38-40 synthase
MRNLKLTLEYDGTDFHGWQWQPGLRAVQQVVEEALRELTGQTVNTHASGRTDSGVHALGQVIHFLTPSAHSPAVFRKALNALLPPDVRVIDAAEMPQSFHATLDARAKRYRYRIDNRPIARPLLRRYAWHVYQSLDAPLMHRAAQSLLGRHDFRSFETEWPNRTSSVRTITEISVTRAGDDVTLEVEADGFLYNMVRAIAGTLVLVGKGRRPESFVRDALHAQDRRQAGPNAPPQGLYLVHVRYDQRSPAASEEKADQARD